GRQRGARAGGRAGVRPRGAPAGLPIAARAGEPRVSPALDGARAFAPLANRRRALPPWLAEKILGAERPDFDVEVEAIEDRPRDPPRVRLLRGHGAPAPSRVRVGPVSARAGVHGADQHEPRRDAR